MAKTIFDFQHEAEQAGLVFRGPIIADGNIHRIDTVTKPRRKNGWYVVRESMGFVAGTYGDWQSGLKVNWISHEKSAFSKEMQDRIIADRKRYLAEVEAMRNAAAESAQGFCDSLPNAEPDHPYLVKKGIQAHEALQSKDALIIPYYNIEGDITTYQSITPDGEKRLMKGGAKQGSFHIIGLEVPEVICEGFATGASIHEATGLTVAVAHDAGNISHILRHYPDAIVAADNDPSGAGVNAIPHGAKYVMPRDCKDFNDLHQAFGLEAVASYFSQPDYENIEPGHNSEPPELVPVAGSIVAAVQTKPSLYYIKAGDMEAALEANDFVQNFLENGKFSVIYGESNCGKTFFATDLAYHVAAGYPWRDRRVEQGGVIYLALEGASGLKNRMVALKKRYDHMPDNFLIVPCAVNLFDPDINLTEFMNLIERAAAEIGGVKLVVVDTLARAIAGGDENSGQDMGRLVSNADAIRHQTGAHVCFVHHTGKDRAKGARGHSSLRAAIDTEIEISREDGALFSNVSIAKQRDLSIDDDMQFTLQQVVLGKNQYGEQVSSCVVEPFEATQADNPLTGLTPNYRFIYDAIALEANTAGKACIIGGVSCMAITYDALAVRLDALGYRDLFKLDGEMKPIKSLTSNARIALKKRQLIDFDGVALWIQSQK